MTAVDVLDDRVLPFYEEHGVEIASALTGNGREYSGRPQANAVLALMVPPPSVFVALFIGIINLIAR